MTMVKTRKRVVVKMTLIAPITRKEFYDILNCRVRINS